MTLLSYTYNLVNNSPEDITQVMANFNTIKALLNGQLDDANIVASAGIQATKIASGYLPSKLAQEGATTGQVMTWDGTKWAGGAISSGGQLLDKTAATVTFNNSTAENTLYSKSIGGNTLGTDKCLYLFMHGSYLNNRFGGSSDTWTLRVKYGATTLFADASPAMQIDSSRRSYEFHFFLSNKNSTGSQSLTGLVVMGAPSSASTGVGDIGSVDLVRATIGGSSSEDSTLAKTLAVTFQHSAASAYEEVSNLYAALQLIG